MSGQEPFVRGIRYLRRAAILQLASAALMITAAVLVIPSLILVLSGLGSLPRSPLDIHALVHLLLPLAAPGVAALASLLLSALSVYAFLIPSASSFARWSISFSTPSKMVKLGYWGALPTGLAAAALVIMGFTQGRGLTMLAWLFGGIALALITQLLLLVGAVGVVTLLQGLHDVTELSGFKTAAVMIAVQIVLGLLGLIPLLSVLAIVAALALHIVAWCLVIDATGRALLPPPPPT